MATFQPLSFVPTSVSGCTLWLDGADPSNMTFSGSNVTTWRDKSGNSNNAVTGTSAPSWNSLDNTVNFNGVNQNLLFTNPAALVVNKAFFFFLVEKRVAASPYILSGSSAGTNLNLLFNYDNPNTRVNFEFYGSGFTSILSFPAYSASTEPIRLWTGAYTGSSRSLLLNGGASSVTGAFTQNLTSWSNGGMGRVYAGQVNDAYSALKIYEVLFYNNLTLSQQQLAEGYLAWKWGLQTQLPTTHPYYAMAPNSQGLAIPPLIRTQMAPQSFGSASLPLAFFNPLTITGCQLWLDAYDIAGNGTSFSNGATVSSWVDKSGQGRTLTTTTAGTGSVTYSTYGGIGSVLFNSTSPNTAYMRVLSPVSLLNLTVFAVSRSRNPRENQVGLVGISQSNWVYGSTDGFSQYIDCQPTFWGYNDRFYGSSTANIVVNSNAPGIDAYPLRMSTWINTSNGVLSSWFNGNTGASNALGSNRTVTAQGFGIGMESSNTSSVFPAQTISQFSEFLVYNTVLNTTQRQQIEGYLAWKWGLQTSLPASHPYRNIVPGLALNVPIFASGMQNGSFSPLRVSGATARLWMDATDSSTLGYSGTNINTWTDKANGVVFTTVGTASNLTLSTAINGRQSLYFNNSAADSVTMTGSLSNLLVGSAFYVFQAISQRNNNYRPFLTWNVGPPGGQFPSYGYLGNTANNLTVGPYTTNASPNGTPTQVLTAGSNYFAFYGWSNTVTNVGYYGATPTVGTQAAYASTSNLCQIAGEYALSNGACLTAYMGEILLYNTILTTTQRQNVEGYLAWKWGLQGNLPATHPYSKFPPPPN